MNRIGSGCGTGTCAPGLMPTQVQIGQGAMIVPYRATVCPVDEDVTITPTPIDNEISIQSAMAGSVASAPQGVGARRTTNVQACVPGKQGNLPAPGPFVSYSPGSANATSVPCPALIPPIPP